MKKKPQPWRGPDLVWVRWIDAGFDSEHDGEYDNTVSTDSFGLLLEETRDVIKIAQSGYPPDYNYEDCVERLTIPRKMIKFVRVVRGFKS